MKITSINPATGEAISTYDETTPEEVVSAITQAHDLADLANDHVREPGYVYEKDRQNSP